MGPDEGLGARLTRRSFLGLVGGAIVIAATPDLFLPFQEQPFQGHGTVLLHDLWLSLEKLASPSVVTVRRRGQPDDLLRIALPPLGLFRWRAALGYEIAFPDGIAALEIDSPPFSEWAVIWSQHGCGWVTRSTGETIPLERLPRGVVEEA